MAAADARRIEFKARARLCKGFPKAHMPAGQAKIVLDRQQPHGAGAGPRSVIKGRPLRRRLLGAAGILIESTAGESGQRSLWLHAILWLSEADAICGSIATFKSFR